MLCCVRDFFSKWPRPLAAGSVAPPGWLPFSGGPCSVGPASAPGMEPWGETRRCTPGPTTLHSLCSVPPAQLTQPSPGALCAQDEAKGLTKMPHGPPAQDVEISGLSHRECLTGRHGTTAHRHCMATYTSFLLSHLFMPSVGGAGLSLGGKAGIPPSITELSLGAEGTVCWLIGR